MIRRPPRSTRRSSDLSGRNRFGRARGLTYIVNMDSIRTSIDLPRHGAATRKGCSTRQLILRSIERAVEESTPKRPAASQPGSADRALQGKAIRSVVVGSITLHHYE